MSTAIKVSPRNTCRRGVLNYNLRHFHIRPRSHSQGGPTASVFIPSIEREIGPAKEKGIFKNIKEHVLYAAGLLWDFIQNITAFSGVFFFFTQQIVWWTYGGSKSSRVALHPGSNFLARLIHSVG
jgi:hypothetical protein